jgi:cysteine protease ATG4
MHVHEKPTEKILMWLQRLIDMIGNRLFDFSLPPDKPVDFLGVMYACPSTEPECSNFVLEAFLEDYRTLLWLTYRKDFEPLLDKDNQSTGISSDGGWGCSIRASQMLVAQALSYIVHGRNRRAIDSSIASLFMDMFNAPLSIHRMVHAGHVRFGKRPSEWFGPTTGARAIEDLVNASASEFKNRGLGNIKCVSFDGGEIISSKVVDLLNQSGENLSGVVVLLTHRLGLEAFNFARYKGTIQSLFSHPFFQGLSSGESIASAYYFFAASDDHLFYLDPHTVQPAFIDECNLEQLPPQPKPLKMRWQRLNPSMTMGFAVKTVDEWKSLCDYLLRIDRELFDVTEKQREIPQFSDEIDDEVILIS